MKITKNASGKRVVKFSKQDWENIGIKAGWIKKAEKRERDPNLAKCKKCGKELNSPVWGYSYCKDCKPGDELSKEEKTAGIEFPKNTGDIKYELWGAVQDFDDILSKYLKLHPSETILQAWISFQKML